MTHLTMAQSVELDVVPLNPLCNFSRYMSLSTLSALLHCCMRWQQMIPGTVSQCLETDDNQDLVHRYDDLRNYSNERSLYLAQLRHSIEEPWQQWESSHFDIEAYKSKTVEQVL